MPKRPILIINNVLAIKWLGFFKEKLRIYDCCDEITGFYVPSLRPGVVRRVEEQLIKACDLVICSSQKLIETKSPMAKRAALVRNAAEVEHFRKALDWDYPRPEHLEGIEKPIVGFWGYLADWLDWDIIDYIIRNAADLHFVLIGPTTRGLTRFIDVSNVTYTGPLPYEVLPQYLQHFACAILPFAVNEMTESINPVKGYEYLAGGCPVVGTPLPELEAFGEHIYLASDGPSFLEAIHKAIDEDSPAKRLARTEFVGGHDWNARVEEIYHAVKDLGGKSDG
jgi:glycosyltransferase involved in cell wall biosynthesis